MNCPKCKASNDNSAKFCAACGAPLTSAPAPAAGTPPANGFAIASMVLGILGFLMSWFLLAIPSILAVVFGHIARGQIKRSEGKQGGDGFAIAGLVTGYLVGGLAVLFIVFGILAAISIPAYQSYTLRARVSEAVVVSAPVRQAIEQAHARGTRLGMLSTNPADLGLKSPGEYSGTYVDSVSYNAHGQVTILMRQRSDLGRVSGGSVVLTPNVQTDRIRWRVSPDSSIPRRYLPKSYH